MQRYKRRVRWLIKIFTVTRATMISRVSPRSGRNCTREKEEKKGREKKKTKRRMKKAKTERKKEIGIHLSNRKVETEG